MESLEFPDLATCARTIVRISEPYIQIADEEILRRWGFDIDRSSEISTGQYSKYFSAKHDGKELAVKIVPLKEPSADYVENLKGSSAKIVAYLRKLKPNNIVVFVTTFLSHEKMYIFSEKLTGGDLYHIVKEKKRAEDKYFSEADIKKWIGEICDALHFLKLHAIGHRNVSSANVVLTADRNHAKLTGFGHAMITFDPDSNKVVLAKAQTKWHRNSAPESIKKDYNANIADMWGLGVIIVDLLTGPGVFNHRPSGDGSDLRRHVREHFAKNLRKMSNPLRDVLHGILDLNPDYRWSFNALRRSLWLSET